MRRVDPLRGGACVLLLASAISGCASHPPVPARWSAATVDAEMERLMTAAHVPGLALALVDHGHIVLERAYGAADREAGRPLTPTTVMYAASLTKAAFAHLVLQLVDEGVLSLDATLPALLRRPLPAYPEFADLAGDARWQLLTPRMLLSHTSGLVNWRWINDDRKLDFKFAPGTRFAYSGEGIQILQLVVEERTGERLETLMQRRVFDRFGMRDTSMVWRPSFAGRVATGYDADGKPHPHEQRAHARAAASMDTTAHDYALFLAAVLRGDGLSATSARAMLSPQVAIVSPQEFPAQWPGETTVNRAVDLSYGLGWGLFRSPLGPAFFKEGHDDDTNNVALGFSATGSGVVLLANSGNGERMFLPALEALFGKTCLPWFWMGYIPYSRPELSGAGAREHPPAPEPGCR